VLGVLSAIVSAGAPLDAQRGSKSFLWKFQGRGAGVGYLMGSVHMLSAEYYPLPETIERAFHQSATLVEEIDLNELSSPETLAATMTRAMYQDGRTLEQTVSPETYRLIVSRLQDAGMPIEPFRKMKPWMLASALLAAEMQKANFDANLGLDRYFFDKALKSGKTVKGLETAVYQIERFDGMSAALQEEMLRETLRDFDNQRENVKLLANAWASGDAATLERILLADFKNSPEMYERLIDERNRNWIPHIAACVADAPPCFVVVGAAHLVGPRGLVSLLQGKGYRVEQQ
jgi:uncharacterized protein YbaP (TraB family)